MTSPRASVYKHPAHTTTAAARLGEFTLEGTGTRGVRGRGALAVVGFDLHK